MFGFSYPPSLLKTNISTIKWVDKYTLEFLYLYLSQINFYENRGKNSMVYILINGYHLRQDLYSAIVSEELIIRYLISELDRLRNLRLGHDFQEQIKLIWNLVRFKNYLRLNLINNS
jgi:hypothetical protein